MNEEIFRKKSLEKVKSPENLDSYIRVSNPGIWLLLISVIVLLVGLCIWGIFGHIDTTVSIVAQAENGVVTATISDVQVTEGMIILIGDTECTINDVDFDPNTGRLICKVKANADIPDGVYDADLVVKRHQPLSFILN